MLKPLSLVPTLYTYNSRGGLLMRQLKEEEMEAKTTSTIRVIPSIFLLLLLLTCSPAECSRKRPRRPCNNMVFYFHDVVFNGRNMANATSAIVAAPIWGNRTVLTGLGHFGDVVVFDDPVTSDGDPRAAPVGRAQGLYAYDSKAASTALMAFTVALNTTDHHGSISFLGAHPLAGGETRDVSAIGGTGDFFMARGVATLTTDAAADAYLRIRMDIKLYECY